MPAGETRTDQAAARFFLATLRLEVLCLRSPTTASLPPRAASHRYIGCRVRLFILDSTLSSFGRIHILFYDCSARIDSPQLRHGDRRSNSGCAGNSIVSRESSILCSGILIFSAGMVTKPTIPSHMLLSARTHAPGNANPRLHSSRAFKIIRSGRDTRHDRKNRKIQNTPTTVCSCAMTYHIQLNGQ
jgi:hypothetical protein